MQTKFPTLGQATRAAALTVLAAVASGSLWAQQMIAPNFHAAMTLPANPFVTDDFSSSSSAGAADAVAAERSLLSGGGEGMQPPPRRRYGRPRYTDSRHNADGSDKYEFFGGAGFTLPTGGTNNYAKTNFNFQAGAGRNFNKNVGVNLEFDYARFGIKTNTLNALLAEYNAEIDAANAANPSSTPYPDFTQLGGGSHIWSLSLDPIYNFAGGEKTGAYVTGGVGFYHKYTNFTTPSVGEYCDYYYGCYQYQANQTIDSYTSNSFGANGGIGFTYKPSRFANERFYAEARYVFTDNKPRPFYNGITGTSLSSTYYNVFPQGSAKTTFIPVTIGIRF